MHGVVCAGGKAGAALQRLGVERVPLLRVDGETLLERSVRCVRDGGGCTTIHVLAPQEVPLPDWPGVVRAEHQGGLIHDGIALLRGHVTDEHVLVASADCPLLTPEAIAALVQGGLALDADFVYACVRRELMEAHLPGGKRTYLRFREGAFTGGNCFLVRRGYIVESEAWLTELFARRKNPLAMGRLFGFGLVWALLTGGAPLAQVEERISRALRGKFRALIMEHPEIAIDIDKPADYEMFRERIEQERRLPAAE